MMPYIQCAQWVYKHKPVLVHSQVRVQRLYLGISGPDRLWMDDYIKLYKANWFYQLKLGYYFSFYVCLSHYVQNETLVECL